MQLYTVECVNNAILFNLNRIHCTQYIVHKYTCTWRSDAGKS